VLEQLLKGKKVFTGVPTERDREWERSTAASN